MKNTTVITLAGSFALPFLTLVSEAPCQETPFDSETRNFLETRNLPGAGFILLGPEAVPTADIKSIAGMDVLTDVRRKLLYSKTGRVPNRLILRIQKDSEFETRDALPAIVNWSQVRGESSQYAVDANLAVDLYLNSPFNLGSQTHDAFFLSFGGDYEKFGTGGDERNAFKIFGQIGFFPFQWWPETLVRAGVFYEEDKVTDTQREGFMLAWSSKTIRYAFSESARGSSEAAEAAPVSPNPAVPTLPDYTSYPSGLFFNPILGFEIGSRDVSESSSRVDQLHERISGSTLTYGVSVGASVLKDRVRVGYELVGRSVLETWDDAHFDHTVYAMIHPIGNRNLSFYAGWEFGEQAPDFVDRERFEVGLGVKF